MGLFSVSFLECPLKIQGNVWNIQSVATLSTDTVTLPFIRCSRWGTSTSRLRCIYARFQCEVFARESLIEWPRSSSPEVPFWRGTIPFGLCHMKCVYFLFIQKHAKHIKQWARPPERCAETGWMEQAVLIILRRFNCVVFLTTRITVGWVGHDS
jgi:hypothetical protein